MCSVLFVCTANICRSPMAMGLMRSRLGPDQEDWQVASAGIWAQPGIPPARNTLEVLRSRGIDLGDYGSRSVTYEMIQDFNLILTMERNHRDALRSAFPQYRNKIFMLSEMINDMTDVVDPVGGPLAGFEDTAREIETILDKGYGRIQRLAAGKSAAGRKQIQP
jgi:protein-tyrosine phosphatase